LTGIHENGASGPGAPDGAAHGAVPRANARRSLVVQVLVQVLCVGCPLAVWFVPLGLDSRTQHGLSVASFMVVAWITEATEPALAGLIGCFLFWALGIARFELAFAGFASDSTWFVFGALLLGAVATRSGVGRRLAYLVMLRIGTSYSRILLGLIVTNFLLTFVVPSGLARVVIMASIAIGVAHAFGVGPGSNIGRGMFLVITYASGLFDKMIIAGAASIAARGLMEQFGQVEVLWSRWFLAYLPCDLVTMLLAWRLVLILYPPEHAELEGGPEYPRAELNRMGPWTRLETRSAVLLAVAVALWLTDFLHHVSPAMICLGTGLFALLPRIGVLEAAELRRVNYLPVLFVAAAVGMGQVLAATKGLDVVMNLLFGWMKPLMADVYGSTMALYWGGFLYHLVLGSEISMLGTSMPALMNFARSEAMNPLALGMIWTFAAGGKIFTYQSAVMIAGYSYGYFGARDLLRIGLWLTLAEAVILLVLVPYYWPLIGISM